MLHSLTHYVRSFPLQRLERMLQFQSLRPLAEELGIPSGVGGWANELSITTTCGLCNFMVCLVRFVN